MIVQLREFLERRGSLLNMAVLFVGKTAGLVVGLLFLPLYHKLLGANQFGVVAVVLSLQALLTMMDLGMSTIVSRDAAVSSSPSSTYRLLLTAERSLSVFYVGIGAVALCGTSMGLWGDLGYSTVAACVGLFLALVLQNLYFAMLLAKRSYVIASTTQIAGSLLRAFASAYVLAFISTSLEIFLITQAAFAVVHAAATRHFCLKVIGTDQRSAAYRPSLGDCAGLARQGASLIVFSAAGAAVTQLDKPIVSALVSAAELAPYFLATTVCMVPISVLAGPVSQFCQPRVISATASGVAGALPALIAIREFVRLTLLATCVPATLLWLGRNSLMALWLGEGATASAVAGYVGILLPGFAIGALGFVPYALLVSAKDYRFQAISSIVLTLATLGAAALAASQGDIKGVCWVYAVYHSSSTAVSWVRAVMLPSVGLVAKYSLHIAAKVLAATALAAGIINQFL